MWAQSHGALEGKAWASLALNGCSSLGVKRRNGKEGKTGKGGVQLGGGKGLP